MVAIHKKEKKFKGKKKAKNVLEKKAKGLKLGQGDRRKVKQVRSNFVVLSIVCFEIQQLWRLINN